MTRRYLLAGLLLLPVVGCGPTAVDTAPLAAASLSADDMRERIDRELDFGHDRRRLNTKDHAAWQIIHGALAYERDLLIDAEGKTVRAIDYALAGGTMKGWTLTRGDLLDEKTMRYGVRSQLQLGSKVGEGHPDQWLGYLQDCDIAADEKVLVEGEERTIDDWVAQIERDVPRNPNQEYSWTLMTLTKYRPTTHTWIASDGQEWSIDKLLESELKQGIASSACGGTHRMVGITHAYNRRKQEGAPITGVWKQAEDLVEQCKQGCFEFQNADGSLSSNFFLRPGVAIEISDKLHSTGHQFEFMIVAMDDNEIKEDWVRRAALNLTETLRKTQKAPLECGALYHALRGLALYRERLYGPRTYAGPQ